MNVTALRQVNPSTPVATDGARADWEGSGFRRKLYLVGSEDASERLVERAKQGDRAAFRSLFEMHRADVARLVYRMIGPSADLEDILQDVFVQVYRSLGVFRCESKFSTWLHRLTVNVVLMQRRAAKTRPVFGEELSSEVEGTGPTPDEDVIKRQRISAFYAVLNRLSEKKRVVFVLHELEGLSPAEIAKIVDAPVLTVRTRLFYARRDLIQLLREEPALQGLAETMIRRGSADLAPQADEQKEALP